MNTRETRFIRGKVEFREVTAEQKAAGFIGIIEGFIPYESDSRELRMNTGKRFVERLSRGTFTKSLADAGQDVFADVGHNDAATFARRGVNLDVAETDTGLGYRALIPDTTTGRDLQTNVRLGIIDGTSFEFELRGDGESEAWAKRGDVNVRTIKDAILHRVNPVTVPAYPETTLNARSVDALAALEKPAETTAEKPAPKFTLTSERAARFGLR